VGFDDAFGGVAGRDRVVQAADGQGGGEVGGGLLAGGLGEVVVAEEAGGEVLEGHRPVRKAGVGLAGGVRGDDGVVGSHLNVGSDVGVEGWGVDPVRLRLGGVGGREDVAAEVAVRVPQTAMAGGTAACRRRRI